MKNNFTTYEVYRKGSPERLGVSSEITPEAAAADALQVVFAVKGIVIVESDIYLKPVSENSYEFFFKDGDYVVTEVIGSAAQD